MADIVTREKRSKNMSAIKSKDTKPELFLRKCLFSRGYRYSLHAVKIPGHPDLFLRKYNAAVFVHGCYWHRHKGCKYAYTPKSNVDFWLNKFNSNIDRDHIVKTQLEQQHTKCLVVWECTIRKMKKDAAYKDAVLDSICHFLGDSEAFLEI